MVRYEFVTVALTGLSRVIALVDGPPFAPALCLSLSNPSLRCGAA